MLRARGSANLVRQRGDRSGGDSAPAECTGLSTELSRTLPKLMEGKTGTTTPPHRETGRRSSRPPHRTPLQQCAQSRQQGSTQSSVSLPLSASPTGDRTRNFVALRRGSPRFQRWVRCAGLWTRPVYNYSRGQYHSLARDYRFACA